MAKLKALAKVTLLGLGLSGCLKSKEVLIADKSASEGIACPPFTLGTSLEVCTATYLGGAGGDRLSASGFGSDGALLVGGVIPSAEPTGKVVQLLSGGPGVVVRLSGDGRHVLSTTHLGQSVNDLVVAPSGRIAVAGDFGVVLLDRKAESVVWHAPRANMLRVAVGFAEDVAALDDTGGVHVFDQEGAVRGNFTLADPVVNDVAVGPSGDQVFVVGGHPDPNGECPGSVPFLRSYSYGGALQWKAYDFSAQLGNCASSRGVRVVVGRNNKLYYAGEQQGGNSAHLRNPLDVNQEAILTSYDDYTAGYGKAILDYSFIARFEPSTGLFEAGQVVLPRNAQIGGSLLVGGLDVDAMGNIYVAGQSSCCISGRDGLSIAGAAVGAFQVPEISALVIAPDFASRKLWTTFTGTSGSEMFAASITEANGRVAMVANQSNELGQALVFESLHPAPLGQSDGFVGVWSAQ
ncbi:MAG: hypothetical protein SFV15_21520 [Polyangiaceae bacterium]|nr:hypothetical protein [Polyangiaceae bacterium]